MFPQAAHARPRRPGRPFRTGRWSSRVKGYPFEVSIAGKTASAVLADQVKSLDWRARKAKRKGAISAVELGEVRAKLIALVGQP